MKLEMLGWNGFFQESFNSYDNEEFLAGRVILEHKRLYRIMTEHGELLGHLAGKLRYQAASREDLPAVGDWVVIRPQLDENKATIQAVLPRKSKFSRKAAGDRAEEQIVAANVDIVFLVSALNQDFNVRRIERYLILAWESGAKPVIILNKADLCPDVDDRIAEVESVAFGVPIHPISALHEDGLEALQPYLEPGQTVALLGSSGVGKSTLMNRLLGEARQDVQEVREGDDRGRHTTTYRELFVLPSGACVIDTPGMRELQLWEGESGLTETFEDIQQLASQCYFRDCQHQSEPKCAVKAAIADGRVAQERYDSYLKLQRELAFFERKANKKAQIEEKERWKKINRDLRKFYKNK
ncbi:ribosome small subunit-dependent GTPase A [Anoxybacteroides tepidamans]|uniref:ribosome small subunit-dependent GTPase A n=1 Tax=Anoxybacteroides tepidamans TaxID=265948 RepID=UPI0004842634|nr:ribosome small subunit-dependent GTPase A [Anoxybacillus tepidamans]